MQQPDIMEYLLTVLGVAHGRAFFDHPIEPALVADQATSSNVVDDSQSEYYSATLVVKSPEWLNRVIFCRFGNFSLRAVRPPERETGLMARTTATFTISLPPEMLTEVEAVRKAEHRTRSELVREALRLYCQMRGSKDVGR
jgi:hypothetical protein